MATSTSSSEGMNCIRPWAPALETALVRPCPVSSIPIPASSVHGSLYRAAAATYDLDRPLGPIGEQVELHLALRLESGNPELATAIWKKLSVAHEAPLTGLRVPAGALAVATTLTVSATTLTVSASTRAVAPGERALSTVYTLSLIHI